MKPWIALFSHSGSEIDQIMEAFPNSRPQLLTNRSEARRAAGCLQDIRSWDPSRINIRLWNIQEPSLVTLHGYTRILPSVVIDNRHLEIYNVHPGDIVLYPELKGLDPQKKALELKLPSTGVVIHRVTRELDSGEIVASSAIDILPGETEESLVDRLRRVSVSLWITFLRQRGV